MLPRPGLDSSLLFQNPSRGCWHLETGSLCVASKRQNQTNDPTKRRSPWHPFLLFVCIGLKFAVFSVWSGLDRTQQPADAPRFCRGADRATTQVVGFWCRWNLPGEYLRLKRLRGAHEIRRRDLCP